MNDSTPPGERAADPSDPSAEADPPSAPDPIATLTAERDKMKDQLLRAIADLDNYRKRSRRESEEYARKAREDFLRELLPIFDNLERALQYTAAGADVKAIAKGVEMVLRLFDDTLGRLGGKKLAAVGLPFDPSHHEAIGQIESAEHPAGTIAREELAGYTLGERLIRPAMVVVSRGVPSATPPPPAPDGPPHRGSGVGGGTDSGGSGSAPLN